MALRCNIPAWQDPLNPGLNRRCTGERGVDEEKANEGEKEKYIYIYIGKPSQRNERETGDAVENDGQGKKTEGWLRQSLIYSGVLIEWEKGGQTGYPKQRIVYKSRSRWHVT